ncbi:hypothetical protein RB195_011757 [Necator americanus]
MIEIEQIEEESQLQSAIAEANDLTFMLTARLDETKNMRENMEIKLGYMSLKLQRDNNVKNEVNEEGDGGIDNTNENCVRDITMPSCSQDTSNSAPTCNSGTAKRTLRSIKPPQATLPKFYGNSDDFPKHWAIFEALVHNSDELDIMEKILLLKESLKEQLCLPKNTTEICTIPGIGGHIQCFESHKTKSIITNGFPPVKLNAEDIEFLKTNTICLENSKLCGEHQSPHILVGLDYYHDLFTDPANGVRTPSGFHIAKTVFGPTIYGREISKVSGTANTVCHSLTRISENTEQELLQKIFELDGLGIMPEGTQRDENVQRYFEEYSKLISFENNIITAPFPLKENVIQVENNYSVAIRRIESLQNILLCNFEQKQWYCDLVNKYVSEGIVETFDTADHDAAGIYYMPHTGVWKPQKKVPLRIVFDASSKRRGHLNLNDVIRKGESFANRIHDILTSSRFKKIVLMCDIESAFTQIRLIDAHKDLCRFLWLRNVNHPPTKDNVVEYRFRRLPFGVTACPSILNMAILSYLESQSLELSTEIAKNLYVDNILLQAESVPEAVRRYKEPKHLFSKTGMNLREYISNSEEVNSRIKYSDKLQSGSMKILGVDYNTMTDNFTVRTKFVYNKKLTKRDVVSQINSIYDPMGLREPLIVKLKSTMREIFDSEVD